MDGRHHCEGLDVRPEKTERMLVSKIFYLEKDYNDEARSSFKYSRRSF
jgi:hypothetical protein